MKFVLNIETYNAAFTDETGVLVLADRVAEVAEKLREGYTEDTIRDRVNNSQAIGSFTLTRDDEDTSDES